MTECCSYPGKETKLQWCSKVLGQKSAVTWDGCEDLFSILCTDNGAISNVSGAG